MKKRPTQYIESDAKLAELILYVADKSREDPHFGAVKLNKILFFADFINYRNHGHSITGADYQRLPNGPAPTRAKKVMDTLKKAHRVFPEEREVFGFVQKRLVPLAPAQLDEFTAPQIALLDKVIEKFQNHSATKISDLSHTLPAWMAFEDGDEIPYETAFVMPPQNTPQDEARALQLEQEYGW